MKEQTLLQMKNKIETQNRMITQLLTELNHIQSLSVGTFETIKLMPGYEEALGKLKDKVQESKKEEVPEPKLE